MVWDTYPLDYRAKEIAQIVQAAQAGECISIVGLSGAGKSNLLGFLANRWLHIGGDSLEALDFTLIDCNRLPDHSPDSFYNAIRRALGDQSEVSSEVEALNTLLTDRCQASQKVLCLLFDRFDVLGDNLEDSIANNLRSFRDANKYKLSLLVTSRHALNANTELAELFFGNTLWLGPLSASDAQWSVASYTQRKEVKWDDEVIETLIEISQGYPSMLRAVCEAYADIASLDSPQLISHPAVQRRVDEFWSDNPSDEEIKHSSLSNHPILMSARPHSFETSTLTAKEHILLNYFIAHPDQACEKNDLIQAVWPEDQIYEEGVRDDSLAQLVRRLRKKLEENPSEPRYFLTVPGRGYRFIP